MENIKGKLESLIDFEKKLLLDTYRLDCNFLKEIISTDFVEYGSSGKRYKYCLGDKYPPLFGKVKINNESFEIKELSNDVFLVLYQTINIENNKITNRSSIWKTNNNSFKLVFHQGTKVE